MALISHVPYQQWSHFAADSGRNKVQIKVSCLLRTLTLLLHGYYRCSSVPPTGFTTSQRMGTVSILHILFCNRQQLKMICLSIYLSIYLKQSLVSVWEHRSTHRNTQSRIHASHKRVWGKAHAVKQMCVCAHTFTHTDKSNFTKNALLYA